MCLKTLYLGVIFDFRCMDEYFIVIGLKEQNKSKYALVMKDSENIVKNLWYKAILSTSFILSKIDIDMPDYSGLIQQALRAFEGFAKKVYSKYGLNCPPDGQIGMFFTRPNKVSPFTMKKEYSNGLDLEIEIKLTKMYIFIFEKRHPYLHAGANDFETSIISNRKIADEKFGEIITSMKTWHQMLVV